MSDAETWDLGADGPAAIARRVDNVTISGQARGSIATTKTVVRRVRCECTLDFLYARHQFAGPDVTPEQARLRYQAGLRFRGLWLSSARRARVVADLTGQPAKGSVQDGLAGGIDARSKVNEAVKALGMIGSAVMIAVAGEDESAKGRVPQLCRGLDVLVELWGLDASGRKKP